jgi:hypothetical protein
VNGYHSERHPCFRPGLDIVIPDMNFTPAHLINDFSRWVMAEKNYTVRFFLVDCCESEEGFP